MEINNSSEETMNSQELFEICKSRISGYERGLGFVFDVLRQELDERSEGVRKEVLEKLCAEKIISEQMMKAYLYYKEFTAQMDKVMAEYADEVNEKTGGDSLCIWLSEHGYSDKVKGKFSELFENIPPECYDILFPKIKEEYLDKVEPDIIKIPKGVKTIDYDAFKKCHSLKEVVIPEGVTTIKDDAFCECWELKEISLPDSVTELGLDVFNECTALEKVKLSANLTVIPHSCFRGCRKIKDIDLPCGIKKIERCAFNFCGLEELTIPEGVTEIEDWAFSFNNLKRVVLPSTLEFMGKSVFQNGFHNNEEEIEISPDNEHLVNIDGVIFSRDLKVLISYPMYKADKTYRIPDETTTIMGEAFRCAKNLYTVYMSNVREIGENAFELSSIQSIVLPNSLEKMGDAAFRGCKNLFSVSLSGNLREIPRWCFGDCDLLVDVSIANGVEVISDGAFSRCKNLSRFVMPDSVTVLESNVFSECDRLNTLILSNAIEYITIRIFTFSGMYEQRIIGIPESVRKIEKNAIEGENDSVMIICKQDSAAYNYAVSKGYETKVL